jgi:hypothetical protein
VTRPTVRLLVTQDLGYCCEWFFFTRFRNTALIAARLGVTERAVRYAKARVDNGQAKCEGCSKCLHNIVTMGITLRRQAPSKSKGNS